MQNLFRQLIRLFLLAVVFLPGQNLLAQQNPISNDVVSFRKREVNSGMYFSLGKERDEVRTDLSRFFEDRTTLGGSYRYENRFWNLQDYKQEELNYSVSVGPYGGFGSWIDSSKISYAQADQKLYGLKTTLNASYLNRYYYDTRNYSTIEIRAWGSYELYRHQLDGTNVDSLGTQEALVQTNNEDRFRFGFQARGGFGMGRLSPMNHLMTAHYLLEKYYPGRIFSDFEIAQVAQVIARVRNDRDARTGHNLEKELQQLNGFLNGTLFLEPATTLGTDWEYAEFEPRYEGQRFEIGPFFKYYNREPDFIYGGYLKYENSRYKSVSWNRNFSANLTYNRYKKPSEVDETNVEGSLYLGDGFSYRDWMSAEINLGWTYYSNLRNRFDFGIKYVPGIDLNGFKDVGPVSNNFVPYMGYYSQLNSSARMKLDFLWRISDGDRYIIPGPEVALAIYWSRY